MENLSILSKGVDMPTNKEMSLSSEGKDQRSDSLAKDVASSNRSRRYDTALSPAAYNYTRDNSSPQREVGEQVSERKGKNLVVPDKTSWHSDTSSSSGYSSESDSETSASLEANRPEKLTLPGKSGLRGGSGLWDSFVKHSVQDMERTAISDVRNSGARAVNDLTQLGKWGWNTYKRHKQKKEAGRLLQEAQAAERHQKEQEEQISKFYYEHLTELREQCDKIQTLTFDKYRRNNPNCTPDTFKRDKESMLAKLNKEIDFMVRLNPKQWYEMKKYEEERSRGHAGSSNQGAGTSRG
jgi:hypothetical protein